MKKITSALVSVHDKTGIVELCSFLSKRGVKITATSGTAKALEKKGVKAIDVSRLTGFPEMLDGRIKTLHPLIFAPIMADRGKNEHLEALMQINAEPIDLVVVNVPAPVETRQTDEARTEEAIGIINVGGIALIRAAASNHADTCVVVSPAQYTEIMEEMKKRDGRLSPETRFRLALKAFEFTTSYDMEIHDFLSRRVHRDKRFPATLFMKHEKAEDLRYGENPHQKAAFFRLPRYAGVSMGSLRQLNGQALSYNNVMDISTALEIVLEFDRTAAVVVKQGTPVGVAVDKEPAKAYRRARDVDPQSAVGGVVAINGSVDKKAAAEMTGTFIEAVIATRFTEGALQEFASSKRAAHTRIIEMPVKRWSKPGGGLDVRSVPGGLLVQERDELLLPRGGHLKVMTKRKPTRKQLTDMIIAWKVCKYVRSNAIVLARDAQTIGTGAGQMSRMDSMRLALEKAGNRCLGSVMASDAFIPFRDVIDEAARHGIAAIIQPGGSPRDDELVAAADEHNISMATTGMRHFKR
ncbi:MAG: bifunctional phosphoribosylaminoimidazolecarboxamide formyltransferase/IMP cyclohydrolase [bacterium]